VRDPGRGRALPAAALESVLMTADPSEEPGRPKRRRRRRRRSKGGGTPIAGSTPQDRGGTGSSEPSSTDGGAETPAHRRRRRRRKRRSSTAAAPGRQRRPTQKTQKEVSAGGVVYRRGDDGSLEILLASRRTRRGDLAWGLAKGGIEDGESNEDAAIREVREETGIVAQIEGSLGETKYFYVWEDVRIRKTVHFFLMRAVGGDTDDRDDEMEEIRWFPMERALKRAAYRGERDVLGRAAELLGS
jgi:8-oxo-dGTP pyrophosphatase MutT (NUDIX family)